MKHLLQKLFRKTASQDLQIGERKLGCGCLLLSTHLDREKSNLSQDAIDQCNFSEKRILLFQRGAKAPTYPGFLGGPGGLFEVGVDKSPAHAAVREAHEEANIIFEPEEPDFSKARLSDRDVIYYIGKWSIGQEGITYNDNEIIGHVWLTGQEALAANLSFDYKNAVRKLIAQKRL